MVGENHTDAGTASTKNATDSHPQPASPLISGVRILPHGTIQHIFGHSKVMLRAEVGPEDRDGTPSAPDLLSTLIYGHKAVGLVRSDALARLDFNLAATRMSEAPNDQVNSWAPPRPPKWAGYPTNEHPHIGQNRADAPVIGLLALGARRPGIYHPGQSTELVHFLAEFIVANVQRWLSLPSHPNESHFVP